jgi:hypothetical protein
LLRCSGALLAEVAPDDVPEPDDESLDDQAQGSWLRKKSAAWVEKKPALLWGERVFRFLATTCCCVLVPLAGIELATFSLRMNCSTN